MGLMGRASLEPGAGLWLPGTNGIHMMFMRFPIDAVFLARPDDAAQGGAQAVVSVHRGLRAWTGLVPLVRGAYGVLELPGGHDRADAGPPSATSSRWRSADGRPDASRIRAR